MLIKLLMVAVQDLLADLKHWTQVTSYYMLETVQIFHKVVFIAWSSMFSHIIFWYPSYISCKQLFPKSVFILIYFQPIPWSAAVKLPKTNCKISKMPLSSPVVKKSAACVKSNFHIIYKTWSSVSNSSLSKTFALCQFKKA